MLLVMERAAFKTDRRCAVMRAGHRQARNLNVASAPVSFQKAARFKRVGGAALFFNPFKDDPLNQHARLRQGVFPHAGQVSSLVGVAGFT